MTERKPPGKLLTPTQRHRMREWVKALPELVPPLALSAIVPHTGFSVATEAMVTKSCKVALDAMFWALTAPPPRTEELLIKRLEESARKVSVTLITQDTSPTEALGYAAFIRAYTAACRDAIMAIKYEPAQFVSSPSSMIH